jgi:hypothetical protein
MKKIKISEFEERDGKYDVFVYPQTRHTFASKAEAQAFLRAESKKLTATLYKNLQIYRMIQNEYLNNWGTFDRFTSATIEDHLKIIFSLFDKAIHRKIDNYTTGFFVSKPEAYMMDILELMRHEAKKASNTPLVYNLDTITSFLEKNEIPITWNVKIQAAG